jgi:hypothetical protein
MLAALGWNYSRLATTSESLQDRLLTVGGSFIAAMRPSERPRIMRPVGIIGRKHLPQLEWFMHVSMHIKRAA